MLGEPSTKPYLSHGRWKGKTGALMQLVPARAPDVPSDLSPPAPCPTAADIAAKLRSGEMSLHASRVPLTSRESLNSALVTAQKQLKLPTGINGGWTLEANAKLAYNLLQAKRGSKGCRKTSPPSTSLKRKKTQSSSSSSSSSSSASTSKSQLRRLIAELKWKNFVPWWAAWWQRTTACVPLNRPAWSGKKSSLAWYPLPAFPEICLYWTSALQSWNIWNCFFTSSILGPNMFKVCSYFHLQCSRFKTIFKMIGYFTLPAMRWIWIWVSGIIASLISCVSAREIREHNFIFHVNRNIFCNSIVGMFFATHFCRHSLLLLSEQ